LIKSLIVNKFKKGMTIIIGEYGYLSRGFDVKNDCNIIVTIITRLELLLIKQDILKIDPYAFMYIQYSKEANVAILRNKKKN
jgi:uncharacterized membrane-anchored protein YitT (DUF2179 family)